MSLLEHFLGTSLIRRAADTIVTRYAGIRTSELDRMDVPRMQRQTLLHLVAQARHTRFGREHDFASIRSVEDYQQRVPLGDYEQFWQNYWAPNFPRIDNQTWPGHIPYYALSSGTTSGTTKYIPISREMLASNQKAAFTTLALFRHFAPKTPLLNGRIFFLGGSTALREQEDGSKAGDLSGIAATEASTFLRPYTFPPPDLALLSDWEEKITRLAEASVRLPITMLSGVPSWMLLLFERLKRVSGRDKIIDIWPELRLVIHGGTKFDPYRELFRQELGSDLVHFIETYPCSEGFVASEDPRYELLRIVPDHDIFFEFVPVEDLELDRPARHTLANVERGVQYAVIMTTCAGLWSYQVGDTVAFEQRDPPLLRFTGRTKYFLSAFGEHLISEEVEKAVAAACTATESTASDFHVGPVFPQDRPGFHRYLIEFKHPPDDLNAFTQQLDGELCRLNEDYEAHRVGDLTMLAPEVQIVPPGGFTAWMRSRGKLGGQHKVPRMDNSGEITRQLEAFFAR